MALDLSVRCVCSTSAALQTEQGAQKDSGQGTAQMQSLSLSSSILSA